MSFYPSEKSKGLNTLNDVVITSPANGDTFVFDGEKWENSHDELSAIENVYGSKNLARTINATGTSNNITYTANADGTYTPSNATASGGNSWYNIWVSGTKIPAGSYYIGDASGEGWNDGHRNSIRLSDNTYITPNTVVTLTDSLQIVEWSIGVGNGEPAEQRNFEPIIIDARIKDRTYVPPAPTNRDCMSYAANTKLGAHNLLNVTAVTQTLNGVTYTIDENKVITINTNGTLSANRELRIKDVLVNDILVGGKSYIFTINQGAENPDKVGGYVDYRTADDTGWEDGILVDTPFTHLEGRKYGVWITLAAGANYSNLKIYPMITAVEDTDKSFAPYAPTNQDLAYVRDGWQKNGAYNIAPCTSGNGASQGVTYTVNPENNIVTATWSSTPTGNALLTYCNKLASHLTAGKTYKLTGCPAGGGWSPDARKYRLYVYDATALVDACVDYGSGAIFTPQSGHEYAIWIVVGANAGASGSLTFKPMITTDLNATYNDYVPHAMTNKELTKYTKVSKEDITWNSTYIDSTERYTKLSRMGKIAVFVGGYVKINTEIPNNTIFATLPVDITEDLTQLAFVSNQKAFQVAARTNHTSNAELQSRESIPTGTYMLVGTILIY